MGHLSDCDSDDLNGDIRVRRAIPPNAQILFATNYNIRSACKAAP